MSVKNVSAMNKSELKEHIKRLEEENNDLKKILAIIEQMLLEDNSCNCDTKSGTCG